MNGLAGAGTLIRYGTEENQCNDVHLQFDVGRGTTGRLSKIGVSANDIDAVFLTHLHSDHAEGLIDLMQLRWHFLGREIDVICSSDAVVAEPVPGRTLSCRSYTEHIADAMIHSGEIAQRRAENSRRHEDGPAGLIRLMPVDIAARNETPGVVWQSGDVSVSAIATTHIPGSLAYRVDTPVGSVVVGGDAGNSKTAPPRDSSTSETVELLANGADILVHSTIHPAFGPDGGSSFPPPVYFRQSSVADLGAMANRAGVSRLVLTHLIPALNSANHGPFELPNGPLQASDFENFARGGGFGGEIFVGTDLMTIRLEKSSQE